jgi:hypothetical protein
MALQTWTSVITDSLQELWIAVIGFLPNLLGALIILIVGLLIATGLGRLVEKVFDALKLDSFLAKIGLAPHFERAGMHLKGAKFLGRLVYWFLVIAFLLAAVNALNLVVFAGFLREVLMYLGNVVVAVLIMLAALVLASFARKLVVGSVMSARLHGEHFLGVLTWWAITLFGFFAALSQLGVAETVVNALVVGVIAMLALAGGLAFGLGGRDYAASLLDKLRAKK